MADVEKEIDALYALPPGEFTAARTQLARGLTGAAAAAVKVLKKPTAVPWAVNQLYWRDRRAYLRLLDSGRALRAAQLGALEGRGTDVRRASEAHRATLAAATTRAVQLAQSGGVPVKPEQVSRMLEAISVARKEPDHPGRFTEVLQPAAFEALEGFVPQSDASPRAQAQPRAGRDSAISREAEEKKRETERKERAHQAREERRRLDGAIEQAQRAFDHAHDAAIDARQRQARAERELRAAEAALEAAQAALRAFDSET